MGNLCKPDEDDDGTKTWEWNLNISCQEKELSSKQWKKFWSKNITDPDEIYEEIILIDNSLKYHIAQISWVLLVVLTCAFLIRELMECVSHKKKFFINLKNLLAKRLYFGLQDSRYQQETIMHDVV